MNRQARRRHALLWVALGPALGVALLWALSHRPPAAVSDGPVRLDAVPENQPGESP